MERVKEEEEAMEGGEDDDDGWQLLYPVRTLPGSLSPNFASFLFFKTWDPNTPVLSLCVSLCVSCLLSLLFGFGTLVNSLYAMIYT